MRSIWLAFCLFLTSTAQAGVVTMVFSVGGFHASAPSNPVDGSLTWRAASQTSPIEELLSVNLTIAGHTYTLDEVGFDGFILGGLVSSADSVDAKANAHDFTMWINPLTESFAGSFAYALQGRTDRIWLGRGTLGLSFEEAGTVPEPDSLALVAVAMLGGFAARRSSRRVSVPA